MATQNMVVPRKENKESMSGRRTKKKVREPVDSFDAIYF